ncbi:transposase [Patescibacteria group bacterium]|nr:transposase [Patescibacteria group bacterium]
MRKIKFEVGKIYHIYNRGVNKCLIFNDESDMWRFIQALYLFNDVDSSFNILYQIERENKGKMNFNLLKDFIEKNKENRKPLVRIMVDCLMPNHFHLILEEIEEDGISRFMHKLAIGYTGYFNKKYNRVGGLFQGPFKAVEIKDDLQLQYVLAYINIINPGQLIFPNLKEEGIKDLEELEKILSFAEKYSFSTNPDYLGLRDSIIIDKGIYKEFFPTIEIYKEFIRDILLSKKYNLVDNLILEK